MQVMPVGFVKQVAQTSISRSAAFHDRTHKNGRPLRSEVCATRYCHDEEVVVFEQGRRPLAAAKQLGINYTRERGAARLATKRVEAARVIVNNAITMRVFPEASEDNK